MILVSLPQSFRNVSKLENSKIFACYIINILLVVLLILFSRNLYACSCAGVSPLDEIIEYLPVLAQVKIKTIDRKSYDDYEYVTGATAKVLRVLKGKIKNNEIKLSDSMCSQNINLDEVKIGDTYIFSLHDTIELNRTYQIGGCAISGLKLIENNLYTYEPSGEMNYQQKQEYYMKYDEFVRKCDGTTKINTISQ